ncbi:hypothetical protein AU08_0224350 [Escherichia coli E1140]|nr:hypothetical protein AU08_0224350 [Escherichia coli E1140]
MIAWKLIKGQVDIVPGRGGNDVAVSARTIIPLRTDNTGVQVAAVFRQIISQRLAGQLAATGREILQVIIPGAEHVGRPAGGSRCPHSLFHLPVMTGQGLKFTDVLPGSFQLSFRIQQLRRQRSFSREPTFLAHILFAVIPRICG